jgi:ketosteroid isomerase-like protein
MDFEQRVQLLRRTYDAFNRRDIEAVVSTLDPDVEWPNVLEQTTVRGHQAVRDYWERQFREIDPHVEPTQFVAHGDQVIVDVHQVVRDGQGRVVRDHHVAHRYAFRDQFVVRMQVHATIDDARR